MSGAGAHDGLRRRLAGRVDRWMIALDIDGTIVGYDHGMSEAVGHAIRDAASAGHEVVLSTGRSLLATLPVAESIGLESGYLVCSNGAVTVRFHRPGSGGEPSVFGPVERTLGYEIDVFHQVRFDPAPVLEALRERLPDAFYGVEREDNVFLSNVDFSDRSFGLPVEVVPFEVMKETQAVRVVVFSDNSTREEFAEAIESIGLHGVTYSVGWTAWLDIAPGGVTKASALEPLREHLGFQPHQTMAAGDGDNDVEMLRWAARGVAMGQATDHVKAAADEVTGSVADDGLVEALRGLAG